MSKLERDAFSVMAIGIPPEEVPGAARIAYGTPFEDFSHRVTGSVLSELDPEAQKVAGWAVGT